MDRTVLKTPADFDVAVFLHEMGSLWDELGTRSEMTTNVLLSTGALISAKPFYAEHTALSDGSRIQ